MDKQLIEQLDICPCGKSNACSEMSNDNITIWQCMGCGFTSNTFLTEENSVKYKEILPELYKDLEFIDEKGLRWYPTSVVMDDKSMIFAEGSSIENWNWSAIQAKNNKPDMTTKKEFSRYDFLEALDYVGYFNKK
jgi:hypothetical protein